MNMDNNPEKINGEVNEEAALTLEYELSRKEVTSALYLVGMLKRKTKNIIKIALCAVFGAVALAGVVVNYTVISNYIVLVAAAAVIAILLIFPKKEEKDMVDKAMKSAAEKTILVLQSTKMRIKVPKSGANWEITKGMVRGVMKNDVVYCLLLKDGRFVVVPKRAIDSEQKQNAFDTSKAYLTKPDLD